MATTADNATIDQASTPPDASPVDVLVGRLRGDLRRAIGRRLLWQAAAAAGLAWWLGLIVDRLFEPPPGVRLVVVGALAVGGLVWLVGVAARRWMAPITDQEVARLLARRAPRDADLIATALEARGAAPRGAAGALVGQTETAAEAAAKRQAAVTLTRPDGESPAAWAAVVLGVGVLGLFAVRGDLATRFVERLALSPSPWPRRVSLEVDHAVEVGPHRARLVAARGEPLPIEVVARVAAEESLPNSVWARGASRTRVVALTRVGSPVVDGEARLQRFRLAMEPLDAQRRIRLSAGDGRLELLVVARHRPRMTDRRVRCDPPAYLEMAPFERDAAVFETAPEGSRLTLLADSATELAVAEAQLTREGGEGEGEANPVAAEITDAGVRVSLPPLASDATVTVRVVDAEGLASKPVDWTLRVAADSPPDARVDSNLVGAAVTPTARLPLVVEASDDHAVVAATLRIETDEAAQDVELAIGREAVVRADATIDLLSLRSRGLKAEPGSRLTFRAIARDAYDLGPRDPTASEPLTVAVVSPAELLSRIGDEQRELRRSVLALVEDAERLAYAIDLRRRRLEEADDPASVGGSSAWAAERALDVRKAVAGIAAAAGRAEGLARQVVNNRLDQPKLVERLGRRVADPLREAELRGLPAVADAAADNTKLAEAATAAQSEAATLAAVAQALNSEQTYNELITALRGLIQRQRGVNERTAREEAQRVRRELFD